MPKVKLLEGEVCGDFLVLKEIGRAKNNCKVYLCVCTKCGRFREIRSDNLNPNQDENTRYKKNLHERCLRNEMKNYPKKFLKMYKQANKLHKICFADWVDRYYKYYDIFEKMKTEIIVEYDPADDQFAFSTKGLDNQ